MAPIRAVVVAYALLGAAALSAQAAGYYKLAFVRERGSWENGDNGACEGTHVLDAAVFDEFGNPRPNVQIRTTADVLLGTTGPNGNAQFYLDVNNISVNVKCVDGAGSGSDAAMGLTIRRNPCWGTHSYQVGFLYKTSAGNPGAFDTSYVCGPNQGCAQPTCADQLRAPFTRSLAYCGVDCSDFRSDAGNLGNYGGFQFGQTFVATANRVMAFQASAVIAQGGNFTYNAQVVTWPQQVPVGPVKSMPWSYPKGQVFFCGVDDFPVVPGQTYMVKFWREQGMNMYHVGNVYGNGQYYEGQSGFSDRDIFGWVCCMDYGVVITSGPQVSVLQPTFAIIEWTTEGLSDSLVEYGETTAYGSVVQDAALVKTHRLTLDNLIPGRLYHYRITSKASGMSPVTTSDRTFTTPQTSTGTISGLTRNTTNSPMSDVKVTIAPGGYSAVSLGGSYSIANVPAGIYTVTAFKPGFCNAVEKNVLVQGLATTRTDLTLPASGPNAVVNPSFDLNLTGWINFGSALARDASGAWAIPAHSGAGYVGRVVNWGGGGASGGVSQVLGGLQSGKLYNASVYFYADSWQTSENNNFPENVQGRIGLDPTGGNNPASDQVIWSEYRPSFRGWSYLHVAAAPSASVMSVFLQGRMIETREWNKMAFDDVLVTIADCQSDANYLLDGPIVDEITGYSARISWLTSRASDSTVEFGMTPAYGWFVHDTGIVQQHRIILEGLDVNTVYHFRVRSMAAAYLPVQSAGSTFKTLIAPPLDRPDFDRDGDVDQEDFGRFQVCFSGAGVAQPDVDHCLPALLDADDDVDADDFGIFQRCLSGAGIQRNPGCLD